MMKINFKNIVSLIAIKTTLLAGTSFSSNSENKIDYSDYFNNLGNNHNFSNNSSNERIDYSNYFNNLKEKLEIADSLETAYKKGLTYLNEKNYTKAIESLLPLAEKGDRKSQHNVALSFYNLSNDEQAYHWFKRARDQGYKSSADTLKQMNLISLLLPEELLSHVASFLSLQDLSRFKFVSQKSYKAFQDLIAQTNFLTSKKPYALDFMSSIFGAVHFEPAPEAIRVVVSAKADEVHFRDSEHLRNIVRRNPEITERTREQKRLFFVQNKDVKDGKELVSLVGEVEKKYFIHIVSPGSLTLKGQTNLPCSLALPRKSNITELNSSGKELLIGNLQAYEQGHDLATIIETFNEQLFQIRTQDAFLLLEKRKKNRLEFPELYPDLRDVCPYSLVASYSTIEISQSDYISSNKPLVYKAKSLSALKDLHAKLPEFGGSISYIDPNCLQAGVYCSGPLHLLKGFNIFSKDDLTISGKWVLPEHNLSIKSDTNIWMIGSRIYVNGSLKVYAGFGLYSSSIDIPSSYDKKPERMPVGHWDYLLDFLSRNH